MSLILRILNHGPQLILLFLDSFSVFTRLQRAMSQTIRPWNRSVCRKAFSSDLFGLSNSLRYSNSGKKAIQWHVIRVKPNRISRRRTKSLNGFRNKRLHADLHYIYISSFSHSGEGNATACISFGFEMRSQASVNALFFYLFLEIDHRQRTN